MNRKILTISALVTLSGAIGFIAGLTHDVGQQVVGTEPRKCEVVNKFTTDLEVKVITTKMVSVTQVIPSGQKSGFSCGDKIRVTSGKYKSEFQLTRSTTFEQAIPVKGTTSI